MTITSESTREYRRKKPEELFEVLDQLAESAAGFQTVEAWFAHMEGVCQRTEASGPIQGEADGGRFPS